MRRILFAALAALSLSACAGGYYDGYGGGPYGGVAYYDNYYGPYYDGYWGGDGFYYRQHRFGRYHHDSGSHFRREGGPGFHNVPAHGGHRGGFHGGHQGGGDHH